MKAKHIIVLDADTDESKIDRLMDGIVYMGNVYVKTEIKANKQL